MAIYSGTPLQTLPGVREKLIEIAQDSGVFQGKVACYYEDFKKFLELNPSLAVVPNAYKAGKLYALKGADLDVVRATTATYVGSDGLIKTALANEVRFDYTNGSCPSILVEPQRTNLLLRSEEFDNEYWTKSGSIILANQVIAPDGTLTADKMVMSNTFNTKRVFVTSLTSTTGVFSIYAKSDGVEDTFSLWVDTANRGALFNLTTKTSSALGGITAHGLQELKDGWFRCFVYWSSPTTNVYIFGRNGSAFSGDGVSGIFLWGAQLEAGANATSYIPTVASTVTRNADVISKSGISSLIGQTEGTMFIDFNFINNYNFGRLLAIGDGDVFNRIFISIDTNNTFQVFIRNTAGIQYSALSSANRPTGRYKLALAYKQNDFAFYLNGVLINSSTSGQVPPSLNNLYLSTLEFSSTAVKLNSINSALIFPTRLSNAELAQLTTL